MEKKYLELTKYDYVKVLNEHTCLIAFEKTNGDLREMVGTLIPYLIPKDEKELLKEQVADKKIRLDNPNVVTVYDLQAQAWRAFRVNSVLAFKKLKTNGQ